MEDEMVLIKVSELRRLMRACLKEELIALGVVVAPEEILNSQEVIKLLQISPGYLVALRNKHGLPHYSLGLSSGAIRYKRSEILEWMKKS